MKNIALLLLLLLSTSWARVIPYPSLKGNKYRSPLYTIKVLEENTWKASEVLIHFKTQFAHDGNSSQAPYWADDHYTQVSSDQNTELEISLTSGNITTSEFRPSHVVITSSISGGKLRLTLKNDKYVTIILNGNTKQPLHIFHDPLESRVPNKNCNGVYLVKDGTTSPSNPLTLSKIGAASTLYFEEGGVHYIGVGFKISDDNSGNRLSGNQLKEIYIPAGALVVGTIRANKIQDMRIHGRGIICGQEAYAYQSSGDYLNRIYNSAISMADYGGTALRKQSIEGIISVWPLKYHFLTSSGSTVMNVKCFSYHETTDGIGTGRNSVVKNSFFKVNDDVVKLYADSIYCENLYVWHQTNGAVFQFGWNESQGKGCTVNNIFLLNDDSYYSKGTGWWSNHSIINWMGCNNSSAVHKNHIIDGINSEGMPLIPVWKLIGINLDCSEGCGNNAGGNLENLTLRNIRVGAQKTASYAGTNKAISKISISLCNTTSAGMPLLIAKRESNGGIVSITTSSCGAAGSSIGFKNWIGGNGSDCVTLPNVAPAVALTTPAAGALYTAPAAVSVTADATDPDGTIAKVEFYNGTFLLGTDPSAPYSFLWNNVAAGSYSISAKAFDEDGASASSAPVSIIIENPNLLPTVSFNTSASWTSIGTAVTLAATATDSDENILAVDFLNGTTVISSDNAAPYTFVWTPPATGNYTLFARATDNRGAVKKSDPVALVVDPLITDITDLKFKLVNCNKVQLTWSDVGSESGYRIRRKKPTDAGYTILADVPRNQTSYTDLSAGAGQNFLYMVRPMQNNLPVKISNTVSVITPVCTVLKTSDAQDESEIAEVNIEPSPFHTSFAIKLNKSMNISKVLLTDVNGNSQNTEFMQSDDQSYQVNADALAPGLYYLQISYEHGIVTKKIIKH